VAEVAVHPVLGGIPDAAGVHQEDLGLVLIIDWHMAGVPEKTLDHARVVNVHLAAESLDLKPHGEFVLFPVREFFIIAAGKVDGESGYKVGDGKDRRSAKRLVRAR
jgi:hypothetical protein